MEKKTFKYFLVVAIWLLSLCVVTQCAIHETNQRYGKSAVERSFSISQTLPTEDYNTPLRSFERTFKGGFTNP